MYRQRHSGGVSTILVAIVIGLIAGVGYLMYDSSQGGAAVPVVPVTPTAAQVSAAALPMPTVTPLIRTEASNGARFLAPTAGINSHVVQTYLNGISWDVSDLGANIGHLQGTAWTHQPGNIVLAGHVERVDGRAGIFASINEMNIGDPLIIQQNGEERMYRVTQMFTTAPDDLTIMYPTDHERLTLITCDSYDFLADTYRTRFIVIANRVA